MNDTHPEAERVHIELLRQAGADRRVAMAMRLTDRVITMSRNGIKRARPELSDLELQLLFVEINYGRDLADRLRIHLREERVMA